MGNYLYNGIELPKLPEWDKSEWPYSLIFGQEHKGEIYYTLVLMKKRPEYGAIYTGESTIHTVLAKGETFYTYDYLANIKFSDAWYLIGEQTYTNEEYDYYYLSFIDVIWTDTDILQSDGTVYLAASEPVPVITYDKRSFLSGMAMGLCGKGDPAFYE